MLPIWVWVIFIVIGAVVVCVIAYVWSKKSLLKQKLKSAVNLKWLSKESRDKRKQLRLAKKQTEVKSVVKEKSEDEKVSFEEKLSPQSLNTLQAMEGEVYQPSVEFAEHEETYSSLARPSQQYRRMPRLQPNSMMPNFSRKQIPQKMKLKDQIKQLSPEMKAVIFANVLDSKLDEDDKF